MTDKGQKTNDEGQQFVFGLSSFVFFHKQHKEVT